MEPRTGEHERISTSFLVEDDQRST